jgi:hypothetical protein
MTYRSRSLTDWLLLRAWIEPDHDQQLRVAVRSRAGASGARGDPDVEQAFADADGAAAFVRTWLQQLVRRWEAGERFPPESDDWEGERDEVSEQDYAAQDERH